MLLKMELESCNRIPLVFTKRRLEEILFSTYQNEAVKKTLNALHGLKSRAVYIHIDHLNDRVVHTCSITGESFSLDSKSDNRAISQQETLYRWLDEQTTSLISEKPDSITKPVKPDKQISIKPLVWTDPQEPSDKIRYHHCTAPTPFGMVSITWKGWKSEPSYDVDNVPWEWEFGASNDFYGNVTLESAKESFELYYRDLIISCLNV